MLRRPARIPAEFHGRILTLSRSHRKVKREVKPTDEVFKDYIPLTDVPKATGASTMAPPPAKSTFGAQSSSSLFGSSRQSPGTSNLFGMAKRASTANGTNHNVEDDDSSSSSAADTLYLDPPVYKSSEKGKWKATEGALAAVAPVRGELAAWMSKKASCHRYDGSWR